MDHHFPGANAQLALNVPTARVLRWGFRASGALLIVGLAVSVIQNEGLHTSVESIPVILRQIADGNGAGIVALGILVMIATPIASTFNIALTCIRIGDRRYALITSAVLLILFVSALIAAL